MRHSKLFLILVVVLIFLAAPGPAAQAVGTWGGQDTLHVPISWCAIQGSPAVANPNIGGDTDTDAILWRRHERPTDNIYVNQSGITFRSAINNSWGSFNFPINADPDTTLGTQGDMRGEDVNVFGAEFNTMINDCDTAYNNLGRAGIGITAVNAGLFHDATGNYIGVIGWGGCAKIGGACAVPYDGRIAVIDNRYLHPASPDRTFPPSPADPGGNLQFTITDPLDVLTGHEFGHALSLPHRDNVLALMNANVVDNSGNGAVDNVGLNSTEIAALRNNSQNVPGLETDPVGQFDPGRFVANRQPTTVREDPELPAHLDLASVRVVLDTQADRLYMEQQLFGLIPEQRAPVGFVFLVDVDGPESGMTPEQMRELGIPEAEVTGIDLIGVATVRNGQIFGNVYVFDDGEIISLQEGFAFNLLTMILHPQFAPLSGPGGTLPRDIDYPVHHIIQLELANEFLGVQLDRPFHLQALIVIDDQVVTDRLDEDPRGRQFVLEHPSFAHCAPLQDGAPGTVPQVVYDGLLPNAPIHALLGPDLVSTGTTDAEGGGTISLPIPDDTPAGYHLVTIGVDGTALTADCVINVLVAERPDERIPPDKFALLTSHEDLLRQQGQLLELMGLLIGELATNDNVPTDWVMMLVERYEDLLAEYSALLADFADLVRRAVGE
jgi:hypothetical protein